MDGQAEIVRAFHQAGGPVNGVGPAAESPLKGFTVAVTSDRRREELASMFMRRGARVITAPMIRIDLMADDQELRRANDHCMAAPADIVVITTGIGFRKWVEAADGWGKREGLLAWLSQTELVARGPKVRGALRAAGLVEAWAPASEAMAEVLERLLTRDLAGRRIVIQLHGDPLDEVVNALVEAGAEVVTVPVYQLATPTDAVSVERLIRSIIAVHVDCVVFTSAPAAVSMLDAGSLLGVRDELLKAFATTVSAACVGSICAAPFAAAGVSVILPEKARLGGLVRAVGEELPRLRSRHFTVAGHGLEIRGHTVVLDNKSVILPPAPMAVLRALAAQPGAVLTREELADCLPGHESGRHAVEMAVTACDRCFASRGLCRQSSSAATGSLPIYRDRLSSRSSRVQQGVGSKSDSAVVVVVDGTDDPEPEVPPVDGVLPPDPVTVVVVVVVVGGLPYGPGGGVTTGSGA